MESNSVNITQADNTIVVIEPTGNTITIIENSDSSEITSQTQQFEGTVITQTSITLEIEDSPNTVNVIPERGITEITVNQPVTETVKIATIGPQGPVGPIGPQGPSGSLVLSGSIDNDVIITGSVKILGSLTITGSVNGEFTGSLLGTASNAISASYAESASFAQTASYVNPLTQDVQITGSLGVTGSISVTDNVGIGTNTPTQTLHVSSSTTDAVAKFQSSNTKAFIIIEDDGDQGFVGVQTDRLVLGTNTNFTSTDNVYIKNDGNVGIGTISPPSKLTVQGDISASGVFRGNGSALTGISLNQVLTAGNTARGANIFMGDGEGGSTGNISEINSLSAINITASANISASGQFIGANFGLDSTDKLQFSNNTLQFRLNDGSRITHTPTFFRPTSDEGVSLGRPTEKWKELVVNNITASGVISSSGDIIGKQIKSKEGFYLFSGGNNNYYPFLSQSHGTRVNIGDNVNNDDVQSVKISTAGGNQTIQFGDEYNDTFTFAGGPIHTNNLISASGFIKTDSNITASGNISASGTGSFGSLSVIDSDATIHGVTVGRGHGSDESNTVVGFDAFSSGTNTLSKNNVAIGIRAFKSASAGEGNVAVGYEALRDATNVSESVAIGRATLRQTSGQGNVAIGAYVGVNNTTGFFNVGIGRFAFQANTTGYYNVAIGNRSLRNNIDGIENTGVGNRTLFTNVTGSSNTAVGYSALFTNLSGSQNTGVGLESLYNLHNGNNNIGVGNRSGYDLASGSNNVIIGSAKATGFENENNNIFISDGEPSGGNIRIFVTGSTGNVGIGTTTPTRLLTVGTNSANNTFIEKVNPSGSIFIGSSDSTRFGFAAGKVNLGFSTGGPNNDVPLAIGTFSTAQDLIFGTDNTERMRISGSGNVGIGTTSPDSRLEIFSDSTTDFLKLTSGNSSANPIKIIFEKSAAEQGIIEYNRNGDLEIYNSDSDGGVMLNGRNSEAGDLYVADGGNVGIGTTSPQQLLDITSTSTAPVLRLSRNQNIGGTSWAGESLGDIEFYTNDPSNAAVYGKISVIGGPDSGTPNVGYPDGHMVFYTKGQQGGALSEKLRITDTGNVGIGTTSPNASAILDIASTTKGVVFPRMTSSQRTAISSPTTGLIVYQTDSTEGLYIYKSTGWVQII